MIHWSNFQYIAKKSLLLSAGLCSHMTLSSVVRKMASSSNEKVDIDQQDLPSEQGPVLADAERQRKEKALVRKLDCFIAPVMMLLMLISYLDRGNIGFAATQGMTDDLGLKGSNLNVCAFLPDLPLPASLTSYFPPRGM